MTSHCWEEIRKLFEECLDLPSTNRASFLAAHSASPELKAQVERLLENHEGLADSFLSPPQAVVQLFKPSTDLLAIGSVIAGRFEIIRLIGHGGMSEVYEAHDMELRELIAIKAFCITQWPTRTKTGQYLRELQLSRRISHLNVCRVFDFLRYESTEGELILLTMELIQGITLEERLKQGVILPATAVGIARQLLGGLAAAHGAGVIHRDLKPSNIMLSGERAVIMDFGIARSDLMLAANGIAGTTTSSGPLIGTLSYMAPEQLLGGAATKQSDLYALGLIVCEMVAACRPIAAESSLTRVLQRLNVDLKPPRLPSKALVLAVTQCLKRSPAERPATAKQILEAIEQETNDGKFHKWQRARKIWVFVAVAVFVSLALLLVGIQEHIFAARSSVADANPEPERVVPFTAMRGSATHPAFSPDGNTIAFTWNEDSGTTSNVYTRSLTGGAITKITSDLGSDTHPAWSSDSRWIAYVERIGSAGNLMVTSPVERESRRLAYLPISRGGICWSHRGRYLVYTQITFEGVPGELHVLNLDTRQDLTITAPPPAGYGDFDPAFSPDDQWIAYVRFRSQDQTDTEIDVLPVDSAKKPKGRPVVVLTGTRFIQGLTWTASGDGLLFSSSQGGSSLSLWRIRNIFRRHTQSIAEQVAAPSAEATYPSASPKGDYVAYQENTAEPVQIRRLFLSSGVANELSTCPSSQTDTSPELSRSGTRMYFVSLRSGSRELWQCDIQTGEARKLTNFGGALIGSPRLSPDGREMVFDGVGNGFWGIYKLTIGSSDRPKLMTARTSNSVRPSWSNDSRSIYFSSDRTGDWEIWRMPSNGGGPTQITHRGGWESFETADRQELFFTRRNQAGLWRQSLLNSLSREKKVLDFGENSHWSMASDALYLMADSPKHPWSFDVLRLRLQNHRLTRVATLHHRVYLPFEPAVSVSYDGRVLVFASQETPQSNIMLVTHFR